MQRATIGSYIRAWDVVQQLKHVRSNSHGQRVQDLLNVMEQSLKEQPSDDDDAGLRAFPEILRFQQDFAELVDECRRIGIDPAEESFIAPTVGALAVRVRRLAREFEHEFMTQVGIASKSPGRVRLLNVARRPRAASRQEAGDNMTVGQEVRPRFIYLTEVQGRSQIQEDGSVLREKGDQRAFEALPRIAQQQLNDAAKCLIFDLPDAAIGLALRAVEATLRYYYVRHKDPKGQYVMWGPMLKELGQPGTEDVLPDSWCRTELEYLLNEYRNPLSHGRGYPPHSVAMAHDLIVRAWTLAQKLSSAAATRPQLRLSIAINPEMDFDSAVATFIFLWNPELPPVTTKSIIASDKMTPGTLLDRTMHGFDDQRGCYSREHNSSLSRSVYRGMAMQKNLAASLESLVQLADDFVSRSGSGTRTKPQVEQDYESIRDQIRRSVDSAGRPISMSRKLPSLLTDAWRLFEKSPT